MIVGIGGSSRSGKTFLAHRIAQAFSGKSSKIISQDNRIVDTFTMPLIRGQIDWEHPASVDHHNLKEEVLLHLPNAEIIIIEGLFPFYDEELSAIMDAKIFIDISKGIFLHRKHHDKRWGYEAPWYKQHIWNSFLRYGRVDSSSGDFIMLDGRRDFPSHEELYLMLKKK